MRIFQKRRKGFTLIELLIVVVIVGILALAAIPLITQNTRDARRAEGEELLGSIRNQVRAAYSKTNTSPGTCANAGVDTNQRTGQYFTVDDAIGGSGATGSLVAQDNPSNDNDGDGTMTFNWASGGSSIAWS